jgi:integrase
MQTDIGTSDSLSCSTEITHSHEAAKKAKEGTASRSGGAKEAKEGGTSSPLSPSELRQIRAEASKVALAKLDSEGRVISKENGNAGARVAEWRVTLGKRITGKGKERKFFETEGAAKDWIVRYLMEKRQYAKGSLSADIRTEAAECVRRLMPFNATLTEAVDYFIKHARPGGGRKKFREVAEEFIASRIAANRRASTLANYRSFVNVANEQWGDALVHEIKLAGIEEWISEGEWEPRTRRNHLASMTAVLGFALNRGYCIDNPAKKIDRPQLEDKPVEILTPSETRIFLRACEQFSPDLVAGAAIGFFAGLRASELCTLDWSEIDLEERHIEVTAAKAKTRQRRIVTISDNLLAWLKPIVQKSGPVLARVDDATRCITSDILTDRRASVLSQLAEYRQEKKLAPVLTRWPNNGMRHSFGSYYYAKTQNADQTAAEMGNSASVVFGHYRAVVKPKVAEEYWKIVPAGEAKNVVSIAAA